MIERLFGFALGRRVAVAAMAVVLVAYGFYSVRQLAVEAYPELSDTTCQVITQVPGLASEEIEQQITIPLERVLGSTPGLTSMRSSSLFGLSLITLVFGEGADDYFVRQRVTERIGTAGLPAAYQPTLDPVTGPSGEIYRYTLESDSKNLMELSEIQRWIVIPALQQVQGVAAVTNFGGFTKQYRLDLDPLQLQRYGVAMSDVVTAINANTSNAGGSRLSRGEQSFVVRGVGQVRTLADLGNIVVANRGGVPVVVGDLGTLRFAHKEREGVVGKDANPDTIQGIVQLLLRENPTKVVGAVHAAVDELQARLAPMDVRIVPYVDRAVLIGDTIHKVSHTVLEGIGLVCLVLILFLGSPRAALIVATTIPLALVAVFGLMNALHLSANLFSLGALDFGIIVDGAIVMTEAILRRREEHPEAVLSVADVRRTAAQVGKPIVFATLVIVTAYVPLFGFERSEAKLFSPMAYTVGFALFGALLCTLLLIPGLTFWAFRRPAPSFHNVPLAWAQRSYRRVLDGLLGVPLLAVPVSLAALAAVVALFLSVGKEFLPYIDEGGLWLQVQLPPGLSIETSTEMANELRRAVRAFPEVSYVVTQVGRNDDGTDLWTPSHIEAPVGLTPYDTWPDGETKAQFVERLQRRLNALPGFQVGISQPMVDGVNDKVAGAHSPLAIRVFGEDFGELRQLAGSIVEVLRGIEGTSQASIFQESPIPQLVVTLDRSAAARFGINASDIMNLIQTGVGGAAVTQVYVADRQYDVTVRFPEGTRNNPEALGRLVLTSSTGAQVPLAQLATIRLGTGESTISHEMGHRNLIVRIDLEGRDLASYLAEVQAKIAATVPFDPAKNHLEYAGQFENQQRAQGRLAVIMGFVLTLMLVLLYLGLGVLRHALLTLCIVPMAMLGGLVTLHLVGETLNVATAVGFIALFGVAVQNGIIMVSNLNRLRLGGLGLHEAVLSGAAERFRPVLMTATVASLGMLPAALATGVGSDVQRGVATVVVGGLILATLLTLFVLPMLYLAMERWVERHMRGVSLLATPAE